jgi:hypothetical protein
MSDHIADLPRLVPTEVLDRQVVGHHLDPGRLGDVLDQRTTLLVFLRHYG